MSEKTVTINSQSTNSKKNKNWQPIRNGKKFLEYLIANRKLEETDKQNLVNDSVNLIGQTINPNGGMYFG